MKFKAPLETHLTEILLTDGSKAQVGADGFVEVPSRFLPQMMKLGMQPTNTPFVDAAGNVTLGEPDLAADATDGFVYLPLAQDVPTAEPTAKPGFRACCFVEADGEMKIAVHRTGTEWDVFSLVPEVGE